jgi:methylmalonyl-CoA/ethylmalonyl-CoA epimerase
MPRIDRLRQVAIVVHDLPRAVAWYRDVLGLPLLFEAPPGLAFFDCGGVRLMLTRTEPGSPTENSVLYYAVADLPAAHAALVAKGTTSLRDPHLVAAMPDHDLFMAFVRDSEGTMVGLMSEVPRG